ncbi:MAG: hypothetical protein A2268_14220 [Candidatus Raymondbacteria bacterium RifOxyA12_full_50_37]|uniref:Uroporphyrinogen decarboxylase (URO-D) domain-containing protein n=1 Tax=Candidatus Raymondbacteria bacterium RIFOXYD12_FULL_49_13 TaxID=1817890 RepID=A0A1F7FKT7_UNCRA|nr:MAG: hypothetical protein A2268_14220 [Candidatus Raymondbacteria bacterium RifOxyA12_full_50_37]OGJ86915.1 MAG: hypothetical protein A2350_02130 [Candidatus Raymondbacteria bacterium RifOxyB12_full_50_8]OGJ88235.1 MAG: hypothetical protein A2248_19560 [Candidatus Raymondbacteria bacterium RIFOXYA2_FULL_49_16]OGJ97102.1 MAG: hypothetical protein A2487_05870 [Candidatus Raymondbacteria bacterium RifOxyC12_full_50_8]OGK07280.1 MAG: hypothetical protein A2519_14230 [Candidatus Raymondbacteria b
MTPRERIFAALKRMPTDRVPISTYELVGYNTKAFENNDPSYKKLMDYIRASTDCICMWDPGSNATAFESAYHIDTDVSKNINGDITVSKNILHTPKGDLTRTTKITKNIHTVWEVEHPCKTIADVDKALSVPYEPVSFDFSDYKQVRNEVSENGVIMTSLSDAVCATVPLMEFGEATVWALMETDHFERTIAIMHERIMENLRHMLDTQVVDLYRIVGPEYATPPYMPREMFERFVFPCVRDMVTLIHEKGAIARVHSHGKINTVLDLILDTGADALDPCEAPPDGDISLKDVKKAVGKQMCLFGNIQLKLLEHGSNEDVQKAVKTCMDEAKEGYGYVIMPTAAPINSPLDKKTEENYLRFIDAAHQYGAY